MILIIIKNLITKTWKSKCEFSPLINVFNSYIKNNEMYLFASLIRNKSRKTPHHNRLELTNDEQN